MKLVGEHFQLRQRQRLAILSSSCTDRFRESRKKNHRLLNELVGRQLGIDGLYCISTVTAAILGGVLFRGRDGGLRELPLPKRPESYLAEETIRAIGLLSNLLSGSQLKQVVWFLDKTTSTSSLVREELEGLSSAAKWPWNVEMVTDRDQRLPNFEGTIATTDYTLLDRLNEWIDLPSVVVDRFLPGAWIVDLTDPTT